MECCKYGELFITMLTETQLNQDIPINFYLNFMAFPFSTWIGMNCLEKAGMEVFAHS